MKIFILIFPVTLIAQEKDFTKVYSSLKEVTIFEDMAESSKFKSCAKGADLQKDVNDKKLDEISDCFLGAIGNEELLKIEKDLGLKQLQFVEERKAPLIKKYLKDRLMKGLYGDYALNQSPEMKRKSTYKTVKQSVFLQLYKNFLVNSMYMDQARFCLKEQANGDDLKSEARKYVNALEKLQKKNSLKDLWQNCQRTIGTANCADQSTQLTWDSEESEKSLCALKQRLREYRVTINQVEENIKVISSANKGGYDFEVEGVTSYTGKNKGEEDIKNLSSLTSYDAYQAFHQENPKYFDDQVDEFNEFCKKQNLDPKDCAKEVNQRDMENFNKLKLSVMSEFNLKKKKLENLNEQELLNSLEVKLLTEKEKEHLASLKDEVKIREQLDQMLENYKIALVHELNDKLKAKMASNQQLSGDNAVDEIRFGLENEKDTMMGIIQFQNTVLQYMTFAERTQSADTKEEQDQEEVKVVGAYTLPISQELEDIEKFLSDDDAQKWVKNEMGEFKAKDAEVQAPSEEFYESLLSPPR